MVAGTRSSRDTNTTVKVPTIIKDDDKDIKSSKKNNSKAGPDGKENATGKPLGPPPKPGQGDDYFNSNHGTSNNNSNSNSNSNNNNNNNGHGYQAEPNPFEAQFGQPSTDTPGKIGGLPPVASLTSPSSLMPGDTPGWNSLRSGPLSPAMLAGPAGNDYFDSAYSRSFPTPNESSLRTGLTPGGGGSMFPAPSPNSQAIFNSLQLGGQATPGTMEFLRSGIVNKSNSGTSGPTSQPAGTTTSSAIDLKMPTSQPTSEPLQHPDADAANGLFMLAQSNGARTGNSQYGNQQSGVQASSSSHPPAVQAPAQHAHNQKGSVGSATTQSTDVKNASSDSEQSEQAAKPTTRSRGKKPASEPKPNNRRKATDTPIKAPANKRQKAAAIPDKEDTPDDEDMDDDDESGMINGKDTKKMTDEEKRKNFLERNRVAALKCRQRKKQWLANLQNKCDLYSQENDALTHTVNQLRDQVLQLKQLLIAHKDCPVTMQQGITASALTNFLNQDVQMLPYMPPTTGVNGGVPMMMADNRQPPNPPQVLPRS